ncbi:MAG: hypothetical protein ACR2PL_08740 [Dehalococcoidia bacterium]
MVLIPVRDNEGKRFKPALFVRLETRLAQLGGFSRQDNIVGVWEHEGIVYRDRNRQYIVSLMSWLELPAWLAVILWSREAFQQEAIYIEIAGVPEILRGSQ